jgi:hypothetical protein
MNSSMIRKALTRKRALELEYREPSISRKIEARSERPREGQAKFQRRLRLFEDEFTCLLSVI